MSIIKEPSQALQEHAISVQAVLGFSTIFYAEHGEEALVMSANYLVSILESAHTSEITTMSAKLAGGLHAWETGWEA